MKIPDYAIIIEPLSTDDGGGFLARVPDLPGCASDGDTDVEALQNAHDAIRAWIEQAQAMNRPVPQPSARRQQASVG